MMSIPLEYLMFGGIGFCIAWLTALMVMPAVHNRAIRLARKRYDDLPLSIQEIRAEKDTIRAGFAAATRELEIKLDQLKQKTAAHATDLAKKTQLIARLKQELDTLNAALRDSEAREQSARDELRDVRRVFADKDVTLGAAEGEVALMRRELAAKDASLRAAERELTTVRSELAGKDTALTLAEREIASIKAEIAAITPLLLRAEREAGSARLGEVVPLVPPASRLPVQPHAQRPQPLHAPLLAPQPLAPRLQPQAKPHARLMEVPSTAPRPLLDVAPPPTRLLPPAIPPAQHNDDSVKRAWTEIAQAAERADARPDGVNQRLRAAYAPLAKTPG